MRTLKLYWLGAPRVELGGQTVRLETRKSTALLAYLSLAARECQREVLGAMFWPEGSQQQASASLRRALSSLNTRLPGWLQADRERIGLSRSAGLWSDVDMFHRLLSESQDHCPAEVGVCDRCLSTLEQAVACYRGEFLEGLNLHDSPSFDEWQLFQRDSLRQQMTKALQHLARGHADRQRWDDAIICARRWLALDALYEPACRNLMDLYARSGQKSAALREYDKLVGLLREQGQEPEAETRRLLQELGRGVVHERGPDTSAGSIASPLLKTKLYIPTTPARSVRRSHLLNRPLQLRNALERKDACRHRNNDLLPRHQAALSGWHRTGSKLSRNLNRRMTMTTTRINAAVGATLADGGELLQLRLHADGGDDILHGRPALADFIRHLGQFGLRHGRIGFVFQASGLVRLRAVGLAAHHAREDTGSAGGLERNGTQQSLQVGQR